MKKYKVIITVVCVLIVLVLWVVAYELNRLDPKEDGDTIIIFYGIALAASVGIWKWWDRDIYKGKAFDEIKRLDEMDSE